MFTDQVILYLFSYIMKHGIRYRILGDISLLPPHMRTVCAKALLKWQHNNNLIVNLALSYACEL